MKKITLLYLSVFLVALLAGSIAAQPNENELGNMLAKLQVKAATLSAQVEGLAGEPLDEDTRILLESAERDAEILQNVANDGHQLAVQLGNVPLADEFMALVVEMAELRANIRQMLDNARLGEALHTLLDELILKITLLERSLANENIPADALGRAADRHQQSAETGLADAQALGDNPLIEGFQDVLERLQVFKELLRVQQDMENDLDDDSIVNDDDLCPDTPAGEAVDADGCSDAQKNGNNDDDNDGVMNFADICPNTPAGAAANAQGCSPAQQDTDSDGIQNGIDNCPLHINPGQEDADNDGIGDACDAQQNILPSQNIHQQQLDELKDEFKALEQDARDWKRKLSRAKDRKDTSDIQRYEQKLEDLLDDLESLEEDLEDLEEDVDDDNQLIRAERNDLENQLARFRDDVEDEMDSVKQSLGMRKATAQTIPAMMQQIPAPTQIAPAMPSSGVNVVVEPLQLPATPVPVETGTGVNRSLAWLIGGIAIVLAVIVFLLALLFSR